LPVPADLSGMPHGESASADRPAMKDGLGPEAFGRLAAALQAGWPAFPAERFLARATAGLEPLALKARVAHGIAALHAVLPAEFPEAATVLARVADAGLPAPERPDALSGFAAWPLIDYAAVHGLEHPDAALPLLRRLTPLFSAEFAIRPFLARHKERTFQYLSDWVDDPDEHVRRLVSEGTRPRLPWGERVPALMGAPSPAWPLLERLRDDPSAYVRRSVANHWNDVAKDHPEAVLDVLERWRADAPPPRERLVRHAARSLVKAGHPRALALDGVDAGARVEVLAFGPEPGSGPSAEGPPRLMLGQTLAFGARLRNPGERAVEVVADYAVHYRKANGTLSAKVFKGGRFRLAPGEERAWTKRHAFRAVTTRVHHPGPQRLTLQLNGRAAAAFDLILDTPDGRPA
jgi:3-methyladenine DNA glycosylase AlkC